MNTVKIYGASDDLVEVVGDVPGCDEYSSYDKPLYIEFSLGDVWKVEYTEAGVWTVTSVAKGYIQSSHPVGCSVTKEPHGDGDDPEPYTETLTVSGPIQWVEVWESYPPTVDEMRRKIGRLACDGGDEFDRNRLLDDHELASVWSAFASAKRRQNRPGT